MLDAFMGEKVSIFRVKSRSTEGKNEYEELEDSEGPIRMRARFERKVVRAYSQGKLEKTGDARMWWRAIDGDVPQEDDLIVTSRNEVYRILTIETEAPLGISRKYSLATLSFSEEEVPEPAHTGE